MNIFCGFVLWISLLAILMLKVLFADVVLESSRVIESDSSPYFYDLDSKPEDSDLPHSTSVQYD